ncbi:MAG: long-chain fatty acid--CoA ligase [Thermoplasmata archaeon]
MPEPQGTAGAPGRPWLSRYPKGVPPEIPDRPELLPQRLERAVARGPGRPAIRYYGATYRYRDLWDLSGRFARALQEEGVGPGDRVAIYLPNTPLYPIAFFGVLRAGATVVQVSPLYHGEDLVTILRDATPEAIVTHEFLYPHLAEVRERAPVPRAFVARLRSFYPALARPFVNTVLRRRGHPTAFPDDPTIVPWHRVRRAPPDPRPVPPADPKTAVAVLQYTGGTTGTAKGAMLTHRNLLANVDQLAAWDVERRDGAEVVLTAIPLFHIYGLTVGMLLALCEGDTVVLQTQPDIPEMLRLIGRYRPTQLPGVPALYLGLLRNPATHAVQLRSLRYCLSGSAPLPVEVQREFEARTGAVVCEGYGLTEASPVTHANPLVGERRAGSIGLPLPSTEQKVVDPDDPSRPAEPGAIGELCVRGPQVMAGYYGRPEETAQVLSPDGWLRTGDLARIDADGYASIVDRKKDMINVGGLKVYPREVEEILFQHPAVAEAAVVGVPDESHGEVVRAYVVLRPGQSATAEEIIAFVRDRLAHYKAPRSVEFRTALPRSGVQKVLRRVLRAEAGHAPEAGATGAPPP